VEPWQKNIIGRMVDEIDECLAGRLSLDRLVDNSRGLFEAADISDNRTRDEFEAAWSSVDAQLELRTESWSRPEWISDSALEANLTDLRNWASEASSPESS
jgi:hypothetical protein